MVGLKVFSAKPIHSGSYLLQNTIKQRLRMKTIRTPEINYFDSGCAVIHALKESFQKLPLSNEQKNKFFNKVLGDYNWAK